MSSNENLINQNIFYMILKGSNLVFPGSYPGKKHASNLNHKIGAASGAHPHHTSGPAGVPHSLLYALCHSAFLPYALCPKL
jgi:hypothetical protein